MPRFRMSLNELQSALISASQIADRNAVRAMRSAAEFGKTAVVRTIQSTRDPYRIRATGTYQNPGNWVVQKTQTGAILSATSDHAVFVERGRRPGRRPPFGRILEWMLQKKVGRLRRGRSATTAVSGTPRTRRIVRAVQAKIGLKGTKGRWPLRRTMPKIAKRAQRELNKGMRAAMGKKPITRKRKGKA